MIILEILINGKLLYRVGGEDLTRISMMVDVSGCLGKQSNNGELVKSKVEAFGSTRAHDRAGEVRKWGRKPVTLDDEITIKVLDSNRVDDYIDSQELGSISEESERAMFEDAKRKYYKLRSKYEPKS